MRTFYTLWVGQTVSSLGSRVSVFALGLWIFTLTGRVTDLALVGVSFGLSKVLFNLIAGSLVDRVSRKLAIWLTRIEQNLVGRVAAARGIMGEGAFYLCTAFAAPLADNLFEPRFAASSGPGAGIALLYMLAAGGMALCGVVGWCLPWLRAMETPNN
jgi:hypothetical protein